MLGQHYDMHLVVLTLGVHWPEGFGLLFLSLSIAILIWFSQKWFLLLEHGATRVCTLVLFIPPELILLFLGTVP